MSSPDNTLPDCKHTFVEDLQGIVAGTVLFSLGATLLGQAHLVTGGAVGLALYLHYVTGVGVGWLIFVINLPFYYLAFRRMGRAFVVKTIATVALLSVLTNWMPTLMPLERIHPLYESALGGLLMGVGLLILFRHRSSVGGFGILALYLQEQKGWRAGNIQLLIDAAILALSATTIAPLSVVISAASAIVLNMTLSINHRPDRYIAA